MPTRLWGPPKRDYGSNAYALELSNVQKEVKKRLTTNEDQLVMGKHLVYLLPQVSFPWMLKLQGYEHYGSRAADVGYHSYISDGKKHYDACKCCSRQF